MVKIDKWWLPNWVVSIILQLFNVRYVFDISVMCGDGEDNTIEENSSIFSLIRMC